MVCAFSDGRYRNSRLAVVWSLYRPHKTSSFRFTSGRVETAALIGNRRELSDQETMSWQRNDAANSRAVFRTENQPENSMNDFEDFLKE